MTITLPTEWDIEKWVRSKAADDEIVGTTNDSGSCLLAHWFEEQMPGWVFEIDPADGETGSVHAAEDQFWLDCGVGLGMLIVMPLTPELRRLALRFDALADGQESVDVTATVAACRLFGTYAQ